MLTRLDHPNIVGLLEVVDDGGEVVLVMPYLPGSALAADRTCDRHRLGSQSRALRPRTIRFVLKRSHRHAEPWSRTLSRGNNLRMRSLLPRVLVSTGIASGQVGRTGTQSSVPLPDAASRPSSDQTCERHDSVPL